MRPRLRNRQHSAVTLLSPSSTAWHVQLVVLVTRNGEGHRLILDDTGQGDQRELEKIASALNARLGGKTLAQVRERLRRELRELRDEADRLPVRAIRLGLQMVEGSAGESAGTVMTACSMGSPAKSEAKSLRRESTIAEIATAPHKK